MADAAITDQQKVLLTATATDANGVVVADPVTWIVGDFIGDQPFSIADATDTTVEVISGGPFFVGVSTTNSVHVEDSFGNKGSVSIEVIGTQPLPPAAIAVAIGEPEPK